MTIAHDVMAEVREIAARFHVLYYNWFGSGERAFNWNEWRGVPVRKSPEDLWRYQEIICRTRPDVIIETGVAHGGSALWFADVCELIGNGRVLACDIKLNDVKDVVLRHPRIHLIEGGSTAPEVVFRIKERIRTGERVMVSLDSDHRAAHVLEEMRIYGNLISPDCYMVVEDTNLNGNPVQPQFGPGPSEAVEEFLRTHDGWRQDREIERSLLTFNPGGFLVRT
jgi:cephalosporin hydroxylase